MTTGGTAPTPAPMARPEGSAQPNEVWQEADGCLLACVVPGVQWAGFGAPHVAWDSPKIEHPLRRLLDADGNLVAALAPTPAPVAVPPGTSMSPMNVRDHRPEPVVALLPSEAVDIIAHFLPLVYDFAGHPDDEEPPMVRNTRKAQQIIAALATSGYSLVSEGDEDTVRVPREAVERLLRERDALLAEDDWLQSELIDVDTNIASLMQRALEGDP